MASIESLIQRRLDGSHLEDLSMSIEDKEVQFPRLRVVRRCYIDVLIVNLASFNMNNSERCRDI